MPSLEEKLIKQISSGGPISIAQFMSASLGDAEHGYYMKKIPFGVKGDFTTAPEISQMFGEMLGMWIANQWQEMGGQSPVQLIELGPGRGTLMADILRVLNIVPGLKSQLSVAMVEMSNVLKHEQQNALAHESQTNINWYKNLADVPEKFSIIIANEFFDALPIHQFEKTDGGWCERMIGVSDNELAHCLSEPSSALFMGEESLRDSAKTGDILETSPVSINIMGELCRRIKANGGTALIIDYGYVKSALGDSFQAVKDHAPCDPLDSPGEADLTAHVNFNQLSQCAKEMGLQAYGAAEQGDFLKQLGIEMRAEKLSANASEEQKKDISSALKRLTDDKEMGKLFKVLAITPDNSPKPIGFE